MRAMLLLLAAALLCGCMETRVHVYGCGNTVMVEQPKSVTTSPSVTTGDNTVPLVP